MAFPEPLASHIAFTAEQMRKYPVNNSFVEILESVSQAWAEQRKVRVWYHSPTSKESRVRDFAPYFIEPTPQGGLYAIGHDSLSNAIRTLKFQRIQKVQLLDEPFVIPTDFDADQYLATAWGIMGGSGDVQVVLEFSSEAAPLIREHQWHSTQHLEDLPNQGCRLTLHVKDWREMLPWIRSWGRQVEALAPEALRRDIAEDSAHIIEKYRKLEGA